MTQKKHEKKMHSRTTPRTTETGVTCRLGGEVTPGGGTMFTPLQQHLRHSTIEQQLGTDIEDLKQ